MMMMRTVQLFWNTKSVGFALPPYIPQNKNNLSFNFFFFRQSIYLDDDYDDDEDFFPMTKIAFLAAIQQLTNSLWLLYIYLKK